MGNNWSNAETDWRRYLKGKGSSADSINTRMCHLRLWARTCRAPWDATYESLLEFIGAREDWSPEYRRAVRTTLRSFYRWAHEQAEVIDTNPAWRLPSIHVPMAEPRAAEDHVVVFAMEEAGVDSRERLMMEVMGESGLRRAEVARIHHRDLLPAWMLQVHGKGSKKRVVPLTIDTWKRLQARTLVDGWAFPNGLGGHLSPGHVGRLLRAFLQQHVTTPHMLRHNYATTLVDDGLPLTDVRDLLGHASLVTTQRYVGVNKSRQAAAVRKSAKRFDAA